MRQHASVQEEKGRIGRMDKAHRYLSSRMCGEILFIALLKVKKGLTAGIRIHRLKGLFQLGGILKQSLGMAFPRRTMPPPGKPAALRQPNIENRVSGIEIRRWKKLLQKLAR